MQISRPQTLDSIAAPRRWLPCPSALSITIESNQKSIQLLLAIAPHFGTDQQVSWEFRPLTQQVASVFIVGLSYEARNVLSNTRLLLQNFLAFRDSPVLLTSHLEYLPEGPRLLLLRP